MSPWLGDTCSNESNAVFCIQMKYLFNVSPLHIALMHLRCIHYLSRGSCYIYMGKGLFLEKGEGGVNILGIREESKSGSVSPELGDTYPKRVCCAFVSPRLGDTCIKLVSEYCVPLAGRHLLQ